MKIFTQGSPLGRSGFVLVIVVGMLGVLGFLALTFSESARVARQLSQNHTDKVRSRLMARSGVELGLLLSRGDASVGFQSRAVGAGTRTQGGDRFTMSFRDTSTAINLNDGLEAAKLERGDDLAGQAMASHETEVIMPAGTPFTIMHRRYVPIAALGDVRSGDRVIVRNSLGDVLDETLATGTSTISHAANIGDLVNEFDALNVEHMIPGAISGTFYLEVLRDHPLGHFNLRLRHLLNAYGDVHRFVAQLGLPVWRLSDWNSTGHGSYPTPFTPTSTALGHMGEPTPGLDSMGAPLTDPAGVAALSTGLGDRIIASRPLGGYTFIDQVQSVARGWAQDHLPSTHQDAFLAMVSRDFTVHSYVDGAFSRMTREFGKRRKPRGRDFKLWGFPKGQDLPAYDAMATANQFLLSSMPAGGLDFSDLFRRHPVSPVNLRGASLEVLAAVFWAPSNVGYVAESVRTAFDTRPPDKAGSYGPHHYASNHERFLGVSEPVFTHPALENGEDTPVTSGKFMSLRDALVSAQACGVYQASVSPLKTFDHFREFLIWRRFNAVEYEKVEASTTAYNPDRVAGGRFTQDYAEATLPHVFSCVRRIPGYLGAPQAFLSTYKELDPLVWIGFVPYGDALGLADWNQLNFHSGSHPAVKVEDFVSRETLPKVMFESGGIVRVYSEGRIEAPSGQPAVSTIEVLAEVFELARWRSQRDFKELTSPDTNPLIRTGPEILPPSLPLKQPHDFLGVVGLNDFPNPPSGTPVLRMDFNSLTPEVGPPPISLPSGDPTLPWLASKSTVAPNSNFFEKPSSFLSSLEGYSHSFLEGGNDGCDLSPFNGVSLLSFNHGLNQFPPYNTYVSGADLSNESVWRFTDSLYWRPAVPAPFVSLLKPTKSTGHVAGTGSVSLWFRIPSGDRYPGDESDFTILPPPSTAILPVKAGTRGCFHTLFSMNLWEKADKWWDSKAGAYMIPHPDGRPVTIMVGYMYDTTLKRGRLIGRYETRNRSNWVSPNLKHDEFSPFPGFFDPVHGYLAWPGFNSLYGASNDLMGLWNSSLPNVMQWRTFNKVQVAFTEIVLKNFPECGPGSWHRVTFAWDSKFNSVDPLKLLLHDQSNVQSQSPVSFQENLSPMTLPQVEPVYMMPWDTNMTISLGETHARCRLLPGQHPFHMAEVSEVNGDPERGFQTYAKWRYLPAWRLDSCVDNFRLYLESQGDMTSRPQRFDVSTEPTWVVEPAFKLPAESRILSVGSRIYEPSDEQYNFPHMDFELESGVLQVPLVEESLHAFPRADIQGIVVTERRKIFNSVPAVGSQLKFTYRDIKPTGDALVQDSSDNWAEIPWLVELNIKYTTGQPKVLSWSLN